METPVRPPNPGRNACSIGASSAQKLFFGSEKLTRRARDIWEKVNTKQQCVEVLKDKPNICWICGNTVNLTMPKGSPRSPQCEHILPVIQAVLFLQLYSTQYKDDITAAMELEYGWSHAVCNNAKTNIVFMKDDGSGNFMVDKSAIKSVLTALSKTPGAPPFNLEQREKAVTDKIEEITNYLNREPGLANMNVLAGVINCLTDVRPSVAKKLDMAAMETDGGRRKRTKRNKRRRHTRRR